MLISPSPGLDMRLSCILLGLPLLVPPRPGPPPSAGQDTLHLEVGSKQIDGRIYRPHAARVRIRVGNPSAPVTSEWTNQLTLGDSAGRAVMRWVTRGARTTAKGDTVTWELRQTYDARSLAPLGYHFQNSAGAWTRLRIEGVRVRGEKRTPSDSTPKAVDMTLDRPGFFAGASDLLPPAVSLKPGTVITVPVWTPASAITETRVFSVLAKTSVQVEAAPIEAWKVEERKRDGALVGTWYLLDRSPYMVYGEAPLPDGQVQLITEEEIPPPGD
jgi:hypothetical protein